MARAKTYTLLSLDEWAEMMQMSLWNFNQIGEGFPEGVMPDLACPDVFYQWGWQKQNYLSREEVASAIDRAERMIAAQLNYHPAPRYIANEIIDIGALERPLYRQGWLPGYYGQRYYGHWRIAQTHWHKIRFPGVLARTEIGTANATRSDADGDSIKELFTVSIATTITDESEIALYFIPADRMNNKLDETWRIRPVNVSISGGIATITGHSSLLVKPKHTTIVNPVQLDVNDDATYVSQVAVYRVYTDTAQAGTASWQMPNPCHAPPCTHENRAIQCVGDAYGEMGQVYISYDDDCCTSWRYPDKVTLNYLAGVPLENGSMADDMKQIVAFLAAGLLPQGSCGCERTDQIIEYWRHDITMNTEDAPARALTATEARSPFGFTRGALDAWQRISDGGLANITGVAVI